MSYATIRSDTMIELRIASKSELKNWNELVAKSDNGTIFHSWVKITPYILDSRPLRWNGYDVVPLYTYFINLTGGVESVWKNLNRKLRVSIEKTRKEGVVIEDGDFEDLEFLRLSLYERFLEQGLKPKKDYYKRYLEEIYKAFYPSNMKIIVAKYNGERVGGLVVLFYKNWSALWIGIPKTDLKGIYPNDLAQWEAIKWACQNGYKYYEEMDAGDDPRLRHFKAKFNPDLVPWYSATKYSSVIYRLAERAFNFIRRKGRT